MVEIDGSFGEGGGQVLRTALILSTLIGRPVCIDRIRAGRQHPGLAPQHLTGVLALADICDAEVKGAEIGSTKVVFQPRSRPRPGSYTFDVARAAPGGSAGSVTLILQTLLLPLSFASAASRLVLRGGTHVAWSPPFDYGSGVFLPTVGRMGIHAECRLEAWGFYPVGGGQIAVDVHPAAGPLLPLTLDERGALRRVQGTAVACNLPSHIPQRMASRARRVLENAGLPADITPRRERGPGPGAGLFLIAEYEKALAGFSALGKKGKPSVQVADEACRELLAHHRQEAPVDRHLADQVLLPAALADGRSEFRTECVTAHLLTNAHIIRQFVPAQIRIDGEEGQAGRVVVQGAGSLERGDQPA